MFNAAFSSLAEPRSCWLLNKDTGVKGKKNWLEIYWKNDNNLPCDVSIMPSQYSPASWKCCGYKFVPSHCLDSV